jgi:hypothetical protein
MSQPSGRAQMERLTELMGNAIIRGQAEKFKPPKYDGTGDVEYFLQQFDDCREANGWNNAASVLHLRKCLEKNALECGRGANVDEISENLRARFSLSMRQARDRLNNIRRETGQNLYDLGTEIERLVRLSYPDMRQQDRTTIAIDTMKRALDHKGLSRHLLAVQCNTVQAVVRAAEEYFQISNINSSSNRQRYQLNALQDQAGFEENHKTGMEQLLQAIEQNTLMLSKIVNPQQPRGFTHTAGRFKQQNSQCYRCGATDHWKKNCPLNHRQGNGSGSQ